MTPFQHLAAIVANPRAFEASQPTARQTLERRLGRKLPSVANMQPEERQELMRLTIARIRARLGR